MTTKERQSMVLDFCKFTQMPTATVPVDPPQRYIGQVIRKLHEELGELTRALGYVNGAPTDFVEVVDALRDIEYLLHGVEIMCGVQEASDASFAEVHWSNMTKQRVGVELIKPPDFKRPDIASVLRRIFPNHRLRFR